MRNEILLLISVPVLFSMVLLWYRLFGSKGLTCWTVLATISANIEVLILVNAFGMSQTLGNILFASTFLVTDIISENHGKKEADQAVNVGIMTSICFIIISQSWLLYQPNAEDWAFTNIQAVFSNTPRMMVTSLIVYAITQRFDVWLYHKWWAFTETRYNTKNGFLWLRNNGSTLASQFLNTLLFTLGAFWGTYPMKTLINIIISSYIIFIFTSLLDTPFVYLSRRIAARNANAVKVSSN